VFSCAYSHIESQSRQIRDKLPDYHCSRQPADDPLFYTWKTQFSTNIQKETRKMTEALVQEMAKYAMPPPKLGDKDSKDLHIMMKFQTKEQHDVANKVFENLIKMKMDVETYKQYIYSLYHLYKTLEEEMAKHSNHEVIGPIYFPQEVNRAETLERDLDHYCGESWREEMRCMPTMEPYLQHIRDISNTNPEALVAHAYVRYLGDLSGGQFIKRIIRRFYNIPHESDSGVAFYDFSNISDVSNFKNFYRARLNTLDLTYEQKLGLVEETRVAFDLNINFLNEIEDYERRLNSSTENEAAEPQKSDQKGDIHDGKNPSISKTWWPGHVDVASAVTSTSVAVVALATMTLACPWFRDSLL